MTNDELIFLAGWKAYRRYFYLLETGKEFDVEISDADDWKHAETYFNEYFKGKR